MRPCAARTHLLEQWTTHMMQCSGFPEPEMSEVVLRIITLERHDWFKHKDGSGRGKTKSKKLRRRKVLSVEKFVF
jgi:hypothetical protein